MAKPVHIGIKNESASGTLELHFTDSIYDGFNWDTWEDVNMVQQTIDKIKAANPSNIKVTINSLGGDVMIGLALYNYLKNHPAAVTVEVIGFAASIASVMAMCADKGKLKMAKNAFMIIHAAWSVVAGNAAEIRDQAENLDKVTNELADIYAQRSGKTAKHFTDLWAGGDYWITGSEALEMGLVDELFNAEVKANANIKDFDLKNIPAHLLPQNAPGEKEKTGFFNTLKTEIMALLKDTLGDKVNEVKNDVKITVNSKDEIADMVAAILAPIVAKFDEAFPEAETPAPAAAPAVETPAPAAAPAATTEGGKTVADLEKELEDMKAALAGSKLKPEADAGGKKSLATTAKLEYEK